jgi:hypothetical protein
MVIVGMRAQSNGSIEFRFYDPGVNEENQNLGTSENNILIL